MGDKASHDDIKRPRDFSRIGLFLFLGLILGAAIGGFGFYAPVPGALIGGVTGLLLALVLDRRAHRSGPEG